MSGLRSRRDRSNSPVSHKYSRRSRGGTPTRPRRDERESPRREERVSGYDDQARLERLEVLVERLIDRESRSSDNIQPYVRMTIKGDCIPAFTPGVGS